MASTYSLRMDARTEEVLLSQAREGDDRSFEQLVLTHSDRAIRLALRMTGNRHEAEEIAQEAFLRLHRSLHRFRGDSRLSTWMYRTVTRLAIDHLRREKLKRQVFFFRSRNDEDDLDPIDLAVSHEASPESRVLTREAGTVLKEVLQGLSARQRAVFTLRHFEELSLKEIAEVLELEEGTVKAHLHRAVHHVRQQMQHHRPE